jgi:hypothetical protein
MTISAKIICDSVFAGNRLTTMELTYPRFIHAEFMTHRVFSRNASSSRAIPIQKLIDLIKEDTAMPIHWGKNQPGMQAHEELSPGAIESAKGIWTAARNGAIACAEAMTQIGAHKQIANRILEPFSHITVLVTSDCWNNFFALRDHPDAQPEIRELARQMMKAMDESVPQVLQSPDEWHLPYIDEQDVKDAQDKIRSTSITRAMPTRSEVAKILCAISAARCARVSYLTHDKKRPTLEEDMNLFYRLAHANPPHMSPCEHQAHPSYQAREGNFRNWSQFRHTIQDNTVYDT